MKDEEKKVMAVILVVIFAVGLLLYLSLVL